MVPKPKLEDICRYSVFVTDAKILEHHGETKPVYLCVDGFKCIHDVRFHTYYLSCPKYKKLTGKNCL